MSSVGHADGTAEMENEVKTRLLLVAIMACAACGGGSPAKGPARATAVSAPGPGNAASTAPAAESDPCEDLATTCHGHDQGSALVTECHLIGHDGDREACSARHHECIAACQQAAQAHAHPGQ